MKQIFKRMYGIIIAITLVSGLTGAFAYSWVDKFWGSDKADAPKISFSEGLFQETTDKSTPVQPVDLTEAAEKACPSVVYIKVTIAGKTQSVEYYDPFEDFFGDFFGRGNGNGGSRRREYQTPKQQGAGSGVIISKDGYIVTNNHVVGSAESIEVTLNDNREYKAEIIGTDETTDLALIKIDAKDLPAITIGDSDALKVGEWVLAIGNPFNLTSTVTAGIVSAKARQVGGSQNGIESFIQTDAAINQGNSGGALVNARGELVGINAMLYSQTGSFTGYGFAIPVSIMKKVVADIQKYGTVQRALLGISGMDLLNYVNSQKDKDENFENKFGTNEGVYVAEVVDGGAAEAAGLKEGDVVVALGDKKISKMSELQEATLKFSPGESTTVKYMRDGKEKSAKIVFKNANGNTRVLATQKLDVLGAEFKELTDSQKKNYNLNYGVQVTKVGSGLLSDAGVPQNFIILKANNQKVSSVADLEKIFKQAQSSEEQTLWIYGKTPAGQQRSFAVLLSDD